MSISRIGAGYPAWRDMGKAQRNGLGTGFAGRMAGTDTVRAGSGDNYIYLKAGKRFSAHAAYSIMCNIAS
ncbi:MAG: hypothetical protein K2I96_18115 [Lachnospiraceae bacterium]|nr:hypothetical protein [Lachnospiraceae bacterium]